LITKLTYKDLEYGYTYSEEDLKVQAEHVFPGQKRVDLAFNLALKTDKEGYNIYVSGPESVGKLTYTLNRLREVARNREKPKDICYVNNFENPLRPKCLLLPAGLGKELAQDVDRSIEILKVEIPKVFESKEYEEEIANITKNVERRKEKVLDELTQLAQEKGLGVILTPAGIRLLPLIGRRLVSEEELISNPRIQENYEKALSEFEDTFRDYMRRLRELDHELSDRILELREKTAKYATEKVLNKLEEKYKDVYSIIEFLENLKREVVRNADLFIQWHTMRANPQMLRTLERDFNIFRVNVIVDNSQTQGAPIVFEDNPTYQRLFGKVFYTAEMGFLFADHMSIMGGSVHRANGGYLILRVSDIFKMPLLWDAIKRMIMHKKVYVGGGLVEDFSYPYVGISPDPVPLENIKIILLGDPYAYQILSIYDPDFNRLFKVKAEFDPVVKLDQEFVKDFPKIILKISKDENIKPITPDGLSELLKYSIYLSRHKSKASIVFGPITDILREADLFAEDVIRGKDIKRALEEKLFRSNLIEEKIREAIYEGKIIVNLRGSAVGQINGLSVIDLGDISFGKPSRISAVVYMGEKGIVNIEREVELSGPIHSKGVLILTSYLGWKYGSKVPLHISGSITFEQGYDEVEGDSASVAELVCLLSSIAQVSLRQDIAVTGSVDQHGNVQPVGGIKEKVEGFYKVCKTLGFSGTQGVLVPSRNLDDLVLKDEVVESVKKGEFHIYTMDTVDDAIELLTALKPQRFHRLVEKSLMNFHKALKPKGRGGKNE